MFNFPKIPQEYLVLALLVALVGMRYLGIDSWTTASLSSVVGFLLGTKLEQSRKYKKN